LCRLHSRFNRICRVNLSTFFPAEEGWRGILAREGPPGPAQRPSSVPGPVPVTLVSCPMCPVPPARRRPPVARRYLGGLPLLPASASLETLMHARFRAPLPPAGRTHIQSNGAGHRGREGRALLGASGVAFLQKRPPVILGSRSGSEMQRGPIPRRTLRPNHWKYPWEAPHDLGVRRQRRSAGSALAQTSSEMLQLLALSCGSQGAGFS
jgi:hypothetical protein